MSKWRTWEVDPPEYTFNDERPREKSSDFIIVKTFTGDFAIVRHRVTYNPSPYEDVIFYESYDVAGVDGYEWEFSWEGEITEWMPIPKEWEEA